MNDYRGFYVQHVVGGVELRHFVNSGLQEDAVKSCLVEKFYTFLPSSSGVTLGVLEGAAKRHSCLMILDAPHQDGEYKSLRGSPLMDKVIGWSSSPNSPRKITASEWGEDSLVGKVLVQERLDKMSFEIECLRDQVRSFEDRDHDRIRACSRGIHSFLMEELEEGQNIVRGSCFCGQEALIDLREDGEIAFE